MLKVLSESRTLILKFHVLIVARTLPVALLTSFADRTSLVALLRSAFETLKTRQMEMNDLDATLDADSASFASWNAYHRYDKWQFV